MTPICLPPHGPDRTGDDVANPLHLFQRVAAGSEKLGKARVDGDIMGGNSRWPVVSRDGELVIFWRPALRERFGLGETCEYDRIALLTTESEQLVSIHQRPKVTPYVQFARQRPAHAEHC